MANEQQKRLMQEALDAQLTAEALLQLSREIEHDPDVKAQFNRLQQVDNMLKTAPHERAPQRLALNIMAQITKMAEQMSGELASDADMETRLALALSLALLLVTTLPLLVAAVSLYMSTNGDLDALNTVLAQIVMLLNAVLSMLETFLHEAISIVEQHPELPAVLVAIIPIMAYWVLRLIAQQSEIHENRE
ncbi:MAG: hypothetical protein JNJ61_13775 [Anaerolineae bacterium]|nr:hypothetical protein [Anaerolineae bacterium]